MENIKTPLGHVTMVPKGTYTSTSTYNRLDLVTYTEEGNLGVYIAKQDNLTNISPTTTTSWMKLIDSNDTIGPTGPTGPTGLTGNTGLAAGFGNPTGTIEILNSASTATFSITTSGENTEKIFNFSFGIPQGPKGDKGDIGDAIVTNPIQLELKGDKLRFGLFASGDDANVELGTAYTGNQVGITVAQYTQNFGSKQRTLTLLNSQGNTIIPGSLLIANPLDPAYGGTGQTSLQATRNAMGLGNTIDALPIANGGTNASTTTQALTNLGAFPSSGGTLTGEWYLKNNNLNITANTISSTTYVSYGVIDIENRLSGYNQIGQDIDGLVWNQIVTRHSDNNNGYYYNRLLLGVGPNNTKKVYVSDPDLWRKEIFKTLLNPITSITNDTIENWANLGNCVCHFNQSNCVINQPNQYGILLNNTKDNDIFQIWHSQPNGKTYTRSGNLNGWQTGWQDILILGQNVSFTTNEVTVGSSLATGNMVFVYEN